ncbi:hypothetical protein [Allomuricauda sp. SCSIO 65647]|uniref:hypothetical protein n=1 Tax=Allomuricauda sp. SCSIO 65647 TaxID=2908843 RepID=UPI001F3F5A2D|nr:hypothetical protein [Muricauda sp. SCSIO 65647]UJH66715.1 hypothetical protein L0P89_12180 [Muricauda sp. SCSIO 65647]
MKHSKQLLIGLFAVLLLSAISCKDKERENNDEKPREEEPKTQEVEAPDGIISIDSAKSIYDNYTENRAGIIKEYEHRTRQSPDFEVARFVDFDYATIKQYIAFVDQEAEKAGVEKVTKLRIYFANYPDKELFDGKKVVHPKQNTVFLVPTLHEDGQNYGFFIGPDGKVELIKNAVGAKAQGMGDASEPTTKSYAGFAPSFSASPIMFQGGQSFNLNSGHGGPPPTGDY